MDPPFNQYLMFYEIKFEFEFLGLVALGNGVQSDGF